MKTLNFKKIAIGIFSSAMLVFGSTNKSNAQSFTEGFDNLGTLNDWLVTNNSASPSATFGWGAGTTTIFNSQAGAADAYLSCGYQSTESVTPATISNWLFTPNRVFNNGDVITFYSRIPAGTEYPDRLEVRLSTNGGSTNVGTTPTSVGDYTTLLLSINPTLVTGVYPKVWTQYSITIGGLSGPSSGRVAFRYFVTNGGANGANSNYVGIDTYSYTSTLAAPANDNCAGATLITEGVACTPTAGTVAGATASTPTTVCDGTANDDVWYQFIATSANTQITVDGSANFDAVFEVFSGTCGALTSMACQDTSLNDGIETLKFANLVIGQPYYVRVFDWYATFPTTLNFTICVQEFTSCSLTQPVGSIVETEACGSDSNGGCNSAIPVYQDITCGDVIWGSAWANNSLRDGDWYRFTVTNPTTVNWNVNAEFPVALLFVDISNCTTPTIISSVLANACTPTTLSNNFTVAGTYVAFVAPAQFSGYPCGTSNDYIASLTMTTTTPTITPAGSTTFCAGGSVSLSSSQATGNVWSANAGSATTQQVTATTAGSYTVTHTDGNGCSTTSAPVVVTVNPLPVITQGTLTSPTTCATATGSIQVNGTGTGNVSWTGTAVGSATGVTLPYTIPTLSAGSYDITFQDGNGCTSTVLTSSLSDPTPPAAPTITPGGATTFCAGGSVTLTSSQATGNVWSANTGSATTQQVTANASGNYTVTYTDGNGCSATSAPINVVVNSNPAQPTITPGGPTTFCSGGSVTLTSSQATGNVWSANAGSATTQQVTATAAGNYTVTFTNGSGCSATSAATVVTVNPSPATPTISVTGATTFCAGGSVVLTSSQATGNVWSANAGSVTTQGVTVTTAGSYTVTYSDGSGCSATSAPVAVTVNPLPTVTQSALGTVCVYNPSMALTGGLPTGGTYSGTGVTAGNFNPATAGNGTHTITYTYQDGNNCVNTATANIVVDGCLSIGENDLTNVKVYPNPTQLNLTIEVSGDFNYEILDTKGRVMEKGNGNNTAVVNTADFTSGVYFVSLTSETLNTTIRVVKN